MSALAGLLPPLIFDIAAMDGARYAFNRNLTATGECASMIEETERQRMLVDAFNHLQTAIELLDRSAAPGNIAANLDLALHQLQAELAPPRTAGVQSIGCH